MVPERRKILCVVACAIFVVLGVLNLGGIAPFHDRHVGVGLLCFALAVVAALGVWFTLPVRGRL